MEDGSSGNCSKIEGSMEGLFNGLIVKTWTVDAERRGMFVLAMENGAFKRGLKFSDGGLRDVIGDSLGVF